MLNHGLVLKSDTLFVAGDIPTDGSGESATGLYASDTRFLSRFDLNLGHDQVEVLRRAQADAATATVTSTNRLLPLAGGGALPLQRLLVEERLRLGESLTYHLRLVSFERAPVRFPLSIYVAADFRDLFDIRGFHRIARGTYQQPVIGEREVRLGYRGVDGVSVGTTVSFDRPIAGEPFQDEVIGEGVVSMGPGEEAPIVLAPVRVPGVVTRFDCELRPGQDWDLVVTITPVPAASPGPQVRSSDSAVGVPSARVETSDPGLNRILDRSAEDLAALETSFPDGRLVAAGIPWFVAPFGRDSLIAAMQTLHLDPERAIRVVRLLARLQGAKVDPATEEEPGKILHEMRYGEMARAGEVPHRPYFGTVDATPLFVWLAAQIMTWTGRRDLYEELRPSVEAALSWVADYGDRDGDGLVEYRSDLHGAGRITNQVWKDSHDSLNHVHGGPVTGPIASVEVQGYVFAAYRELADAADLFGDGAWAAELRACAEEVRATVEAKFWIADAGWYAQALDGGKAQVRAIASNAAQLLMTGLPSPERAATMAERVLRPDLDSGWGIRTLSAGAVTYNPMSYHNGSVWPHDNSIIAAGLARYGHAEAAATVARGLIDAGRADPLGRLPELYCGLERTSDRYPSPVWYPVSCSPQAWAAASIPHLMRSLLNLDPDPFGRAVRIVPALPSWLDWITVHDLTVYGQTGVLTVRRTPGGTRVDTDGIEVVTG